MTRVLLVSNRFSPDYGGIETVSLALAQGFAKKGLDVEILTRTPDRAAIDSEFRVTRSPGPYQLLKSVLRADVVFHNNICLRFLWPALVLRKPLVFAVHNWLLNNEGRIGYRERLKRFIISQYRAVSVSKAVQATLPFESTLVYNSYDPDAFYSAENDLRIRRSVAFVGRLVQGKGCSVLIEALSLLRDRGYDFNCSVIGDGAERDRIEKAVEALDLRQVKFHGSLTPPEIGDILRETEILAVPSHYGEAFGIVALEGVASGCFVVTSDDGGLPEAMGACGVTVSQNNATSLADAIANAWDLESWKLASFRKARADHLRFFSRDSMIDGYSKVILDAASGGHGEVVDQENRRLFSGSWARRVRTSFKHRGY
jgi:glycogen(starch) synthase